MYISANISSDFYFKTCQNGGCINLVSVSTYYSPHCTAVFSTTYACLPGVQAYLDPLFCCENQGKCAGTPTRPAEHRGTVGIRPNHLFAASLTLFQPGTLHSANYDTKSYIEINILIFRVLIHVAFLMHSSRWFCFTHN